MSKSLLKRIFYFVFTVAVTISIFFYLFSVVSLGEILLAIRRISPYYLVMFFMFSMIMSVGRTWRYQLFLRVSGHRPGNVAMFLVTLARNFFSDLLPARLGTLVYIYLVQGRLGVPFDAAASSFALSFIFDIIVLSILVIGASVLVSSAFISPIIMITASLFVLAICLFILMGLSKGLKWLAALIDRLRWLSELLRQNVNRNLISTAQELEKVRSQKIYVRAIALSFVVRFGKYLSLFALLLAIVVPLGFKPADFPLPKVFLGLCGAELSASLPISGIAGFGAYEGVWTLIFQILGYSKELSVLTSVAHHLISQVYGYLLGAVALILLLIPSFNLIPEKFNHQKRQAGDLFWVHCALLFFTIGAIYSAVVFASQGTDSNEVKKNQSGDDKTIQLAHNQVPKGKVAFAHSGAIYIQPINSKKPTRVVEKGEYPRWSPDGNRIAFVNGNDIGVVTVHSGNTQYIAKAKQARAVAFDTTGGAVLYTDGKRIVSVDIRSGKKTIVNKGKVYLELDIAKEGDLLAVTLKERFGYYVYAIDVRRNSMKKIARGCSASLSPDGARITVNGRKHLKLNIYDVTSGKKVRWIDAPPGLEFDNQFWSNHSDWIASVSEGDGNNIYIHKVSANRAWQITHLGNCDRPDLYIEDSAAL